MKPAIILCCVLGVLAAIPSSAEAQGRRSRRGGVVQGPDGPLYDTRSPEWRMSGGNIFVYEQLMEQKMMLRQQQMMMKQQMMMNRAQQKTQKNGQAGSSAGAGKSKRLTPKKPGSSKAKDPTEKN
jgi:hypothetical protein